MTENHILSENISAAKPILQAELERAKTATRIAFFIAGFGLSCWAPMVPFAQQRMNADTAQLGTVLLCLGLGAVIGMPVAGSLSARIGSRPVIMGGTLGLFIAIPLLALLSTPLLIGAALLLFGLSIGAVDVAANIHGTEVQAQAGKPLMSGFHGFYSIGGLCGVGGMTALLASGLGIATAASMASALILICICFAASRFLITRSTEEHPLFVIPKGAVLVIGILAMIVFLAEGAVLDWGAILLTKFKGVDLSISGIAYTIFALSMTVSRFIGDWIVHRVGELKALTIGFVFTAVGIAIFSVADPLALSMIGVAVAGLAAGNMVPILFTLAARQKLMSSSHGIAAASSLGYLGVLLGPAMIGYVAQVIGLPQSFLGLSVVVLAALLGVSISVRAGNP